VRYYLDTSALVKLVINEAGSDDIRAVAYAATDLHTCRVAYPEARAAIAAMGRSARLDIARSLASRAALEGAWLRVQVIEVTSGLAATAGDLAERHALRGFDAVHLAAALEVAGDELILATWDARLWHAAHAEGLRVMPAELSGA
jgi:predicted nucleic acid-binding protein